MFEKERSSNSVGYLVVILFFLCAWAVAQLVIYLEG
jgi:hypothetical protein